MSQNSQINKLLKIKISREVGKKLLKQKLLKHNHFYFTLFNIHGIKYDIFDSLIEQNEFYNI